MPFCVLTVLLRLALLCVLSKQCFLSRNLLGCLVSGSVTVMLLLQAISLQTVSAAALLLHVHLKLLGRGLLQDSDHTGGKSTFCIRGIWFLWASTALSKLPMHLPPSDVKFVTDSELMVSHSEKAEEHCDIHKPKEKSCIHKQTASNHHAVFPLISS